MLRSWMGWVAAFAVVATASAQGARRADRGIILEGENKLRYILKQLSLDAQQAKDADSLIAVHTAMMAEVSKEEALIARLYEIQALMVEMKAAEADGNTARVGELKEQIRQLAPDYQADKQFYESLDGILKDEQKKQLEKVRARITANPDVSLTPNDVIEAARETNLEADQRTKLDDVLKNFRADMAKEPPQTLPDRLKKVDDLAAKVRELLKPEQAKQFNATIERLRPPMPQSTATQPRVRITKQSGKVEPADLSEATEEVGIVPQPPNDPIPDVPAQKPKP